MVEPRERLLEGFLARLAHARDADAFALRGGMLVRTWVPGARAIRDIDLICALPAEPRSIRARLRAVLADRKTDDDVVFDAGRFRIDWWSERTGLTLFAAGDVAGAPAEMTADLWFGVDAGRLQRGVVTTARRAFPFWLCSPELVIASKLGVLAELGPDAWRPKDLVDIWLVLKRFPPRRPLGVLGDAIERRCGEDWQALLSASWWTEPRAEMRWVRHGFPIAIDAVVAEVQHALSPFGSRS